MVTVKGGREKGGNASLPGDSECPIGPRKKPEASRARTDRQETGRVSLANLFRRRVDRWLLPSAEEGCLLVVTLNSSLCSRYRSVRLFCCSISSAKSIKEGRLEGLSLSPSNSVCAPHLAHCCGGGGELPRMCNACGQCGSGRLVRPSSLSLTSGAP
eukprot:scaffold14932_cov133-Isochrysis_galbana.AAC.2